MAPLEMRLLNTAQERIYDLPLKVGIFDRFALDTYFGALCANQVEQSSSWRSEVNPVTVEEDWVEGFEIRVEVEGRHHRKTYPLDALAPLAQRLVPELRRRGLLDKGEQCSFLLTKLSTAPNTRTWRLKLPVLVEKAFPCSSASPLPVFVPQAIAEELRRRAKAVEVEIGAFLLGRLIRDSGQIGVEVTAEVPARQVMASATHIRFLPAATAEALKTARMRGESLVGWFHSHPFATTEGLCGRSGGALFFSHDDFFVHETQWRAPYHVGLVNAPLASKGQPNYGMWGWRDGHVQRINFVEVV